MINLSAATDFPLLCVEYTSILLLCNHEFIDLLQNSPPWSTLILFGLWPNASKILWETLVIVTPFLFFKGVTQAYLV